MSNEEIIIAHVEHVVDKTVAQTRGAADDYFSLMQAFSFYPVGGTELAEKMKSDILSIGRIDPALRPVGTGPRSSGYGRYPSAFLTRSSVNGACRKRTPVRAITALETAGVIAGVAICPTPVGWLSV